MLRSLFIVRERIIRRFLPAFIIGVMSCIGLSAVSDYEYDDLPDGTYTVEAEISCYVNAMGGVEFGTPLLVSSYVEADADGSKVMTLYFTKSQVTIYGITCDTFIDVSPSYITETDGIKSGTLGYYNDDGILITDTVTYTLADDTAENAQKERVHYVDSISFPIEYESDKYELSLFVNSNVMGTQFTKDGYAATLSVDWSSISPEGSFETETIPSDDDVDHEEKNTSSNIENKDGFNIYHAKKNDDKDSESENKAAVGSYAAFFREDILIAVMAAAIIMLISGMMLVIAARRERK